MDNILHQLDLGGLPVFKSFIHHNWRGFVDLGRPPQQDSGAILSIGAWSFRAFRQWGSVSLPGGLRPEMQAWKPRPKRESISRLLLDWLKSCGFGMAGGSFAFSAAKRGSSAANSEGWACHPSRFGGLCTHPLSKNG